MTSWKHLNPFNLSCIGVSKTSRDSQQNLGFLIVDDTFEQILVKETPNWNLRDWRKQQLVHELFQTGLLSFALAWPSRAGDTAEESIVSQLQIW